MEKGQRYLLQDFEWRMDNDIYCRVSNGEETAIWSTAGVLKTSATTELLSKRH
jgi:hypothetical protein